MKDKDFTDMTDEELTVFGSNLIDSIKGGGASKQTEAELMHAMYILLIKKMLNEWLSKMELSQKDLAQKVGVTPTAICEYKKGKKLPSLPVFFMIMSFICPGFEGIFEVKK